MNSEIWKVNSNQKAKRVERSDLISLRNSESRRFSLKRKIGLFPVSEEIEKIKEWFRTLDPFSKVRLDANGSLNMNELSLWSTEFSTESRIEYLEQPVSDDFRDELFEFARNSKLPLAIDETIVAMGSPQSAKEQGWSGFYVIKPTLLTDWSLTLKFAKENPDKTVFSTVYESPFGYEALVRASRFSNLEAGIGRETLKHNKSELAGHHAEILDSPAVSMSELNDLWENLS
jgi:O-succinylbenzoate synthase